MSQTNYCCSPKSNDLHPGCVTGLCRCFGDVKETQECQFMHKSWRTLGWVLEASVTSFDDRIELFHYREASRNRVRTRSKASWFSIWKCSTRRSDADSKFVRANESSAVPEKITKTNRAFCFKSGGSRKKQKKADFRSLILQLRHGQETSEKSGKCIRS